ncbi:MAG: hypothetical protein ABIZ04_21330 [Opitutus sp.]
MARRSFWTVIVLLVLTGSAWARGPVAIIEDTVWSPDDATRDGAAELGVLVALAQLQATQPVVGLVGIGDRRGIFQDGTRRGLEYAVGQGVPVVRLARGVRDCSPPETDLLIDGGNLSPEAAVKLLGECLARFGPLPKNDSPEPPTPRQQRNLQKKLQLYRAAFTFRQPAASATVAMR